MLENLTQRIKGMHGTAWVRERLEAVVEVSNLPKKRAFGKCAVDHVIGAIFLCGERHLSPDSLKCPSTCQAVPFLETSDLGFLIGGDDDGLIDSLVDAGFEEEGHFVDDYRAVFAYGDLSHESLLLMSDTWMDDTFESAELGRASKHDGSQCMAVQ
jgi:hypothetical protein